MSDNEANMAQIPVQGNQPAGGQPGLQQISAKEFAAKFKSKRECFTFLASECEIYLPPYGKCLFHHHLIQIVP